MSELQSSFWQWCIDPFRTDSFRFIELAAILIAFYGISVELDAQQDERVAQREEREARREERLARAAQLLPEAGFDFGKRWALELLNAEDVPLERLELVPRHLAEHESWKGLSRGEREKSVLGHEECQPRTYLRNVTANGANLNEAVLPCADLGYAKLSKASLLRADLRGGFLRCAELPDAILPEVKLQGAQLHSADMRDTDMRVARLQKAQLNGADLQGANLKNAVLEGTWLYGANLRGVKGVDCKMLRLSTGWEQAYRDESLACDGAMPKGERSTVEAACGRAEEAMAGA